MSIKEFWGKSGDHILVFMIILLAVGSSFIIGRMSVLNGSELPVQIRTSVGDAINLSGESSLATGNMQDLTPSADENEEKPRYGLYCASKNSKIYHLWDCSSVASIKDENKIWFDLEEEAIASGRTLATDCK